MKSELTKVCLEAIPKSDFSSLRVVTHFFEWA